MSVTVSPYPLFPVGTGLRDTWKLSGAVTVILPFKPVAETINCCISGLADAVPAQAEMIPVAGPAVIAGCVAAAGFTVMEYVIRVPLQLVPILTGKPVIIAVTGDELLFTAINDAILPVPPAAKPIPGMVLTHE
jgi:hypothetical protein